MMSGASGPSKPSHQSGCLGGGGLGCSSMFVVRNHIYDKQMMHSSKLVRDKRVSKFL